MIQLTFISNGIQLLDIPHYFIRSIKKCIHNRKSRNRILKKPFVDDYAFDLGYHHSYSLVIFTIGLIFCPIVPLITVFSTLFFMFKYYVDKYNLTFVYNKEFEGGGIIKKNVLPYLLFAIYVFQILNLGLFILKFGKVYLYAGFALILL